MAVCLSLCLYVWLFDCLSICPYVCLSVCLQHINYEIVIASEDSKTNKP